MRSALPPPASEAEDSVSAADLAGAGRFSQ